MGFLDDVANVATGGLYGGATGQGSWEGSLGAALALGSGDTNMAAHISGIMYPGESREGMKGGWNSDVGKAVNEVTGLGDTYKDIYQIYHGLGKYANTSGNWWDKIWSGAQAPLNNNGLTEYTVKKPLNWLLHGGGAWDDATANTIADVGTNIVGSAYGPGWGAAAGAGTSWLLDNDTGTAVKRTASGAGSGYLSNATSSGGTGGGYSYGEGDIIQGAEGIAADTGTTASALGNAAATTAVDQLSVDALASEGLSLSGPAAQNIGSAAMDTSYGLGTAFSDAAAMDGLSLSGLAEQANDPSLWSRLVNGVSGITKKDILGGLNIAKTGLGAYNNYQQRKAVENETDARRAAFGYIRRLQANPALAYRNDPGLQALRRRRMSDLGAQYRARYGGTAGGAFARGIGRAGAEFDRAAAQDAINQRLAMIGATQPAQNYRLQYGGTTGGGLASAAQGGINDYISMDTLDRLIAAYGR